jgi:hypothetical protein
MRAIFYTLLVTMLLSSGFSASVAAQPSLPVPGDCHEGVQQSGALWLICIPESGWNGDLVVYAHGYVPYYEPLSLQHLELPDGTYIPDIIQSLGFAFATTSFRQNGLVVREGMDDIRDLVEIFPTVSGGIQPQRRYITGASQGGLIATLLLEQSPDVFDGGLAACGPIGNFRQQLNYFGDFHTLFNYFFPGVVPGDVTHVPLEVIENWESVYVPAVIDTIEREPRKARELIRVSGAAVNPLNPATIRTTILGVLTYNVNATNDAFEKLGGNPYNNIGRWYSGSSNDLHLNRNVKRTAMQLRVLGELQHYQTSGSLSRPLVTMHTTGDEIVPFWHQSMYRESVQTVVGGRITTVPIIRYGHCNFTAGEVVLAFAALVFQASQQTLYIPEQYRTDPAS